MDEVNNQIYIVDRVDQVKWYIDEETAMTFCLQMDKNHRVIRNWLMEMTSNTVVISGQGVMPRMGSSDHPNNVYQSISRDQFKLYFADADDAMLFKLTWGGE
jgi:hypothetical protein